MLAREGVGWRGYQVSGVEHGKYIFRRDRHYPTPVVRTRSFRRTTLTPSQDCSSCQYLLVTFDAREEEGVILRVGVGTSMSKGWGGHLRVALSSTQIPPVATKLTIYPPPPNR
eukprot:548895-Hanusia_phi.AAC.1